MTATEEDRQYDRLSNEYAAWNKAQGLSLGSADEHLFDETLTAEQQEWVRNFNRRWEGVPAAAREFFADLAKRD
jgi:hypothetical protein